MTWRRPSRRRILLAGIRGFRLRDAHLLLVWRGAVLRLLVLRLLVLRAGSVGARLGVRRRLLRRGVIVVVAVRHGPAGAVEGAAAASGAAAGDAEDAVAGAGVALARVHECQRRKQGVSSSLAESRRKRWDGGRMRAKEA